MNFRFDSRSLRLDRIEARIRTGESFKDEPGKTLSDLLRASGVR